MDISNVIGWKFNHQPGMRCKEIDGVMTITEFPGGIPSIADQAKWIGEYTAWEASGGMKDKQVNKEFNDSIRVLIETLVPMIQDGSIITAAPSDILTTAKAKRKQEL